jgi:hypothetical protein
MMDDIDRTTDWWAAALKGERGPIDADNPKSGFYRAKAKDKTLSAVAIWYDSNSGELRYQENGRDVDDMKARERWPYVSRRPISEATFWHFRDTGIWNDIDDTVQAKAEATDPIQVLKLGLEATKVAAKKYAKIETDEDMGLAQSLRAKAMELRGEADKRGKALYDPLYREYKEVYDTWNPLVKALDTIAVQIRKSMETYNDWKLEQANKSKVSDNAAPNAPPPSVQVSGGGGRAAHVGVKDTVTEIDIDKAFSFFREKPELQQLLLQMAQRSVDAGIDVPGAVVVKKSAIR